MFTPALATEWAVKRGQGSSPATSPSRTMRPNPAAAMGGAAACAQKKGPFRLTASAASRCSSVVSAKAAARKLAAEHDQHVQTPQRGRGLGHDPPASLGRPQVAGHDLRAHAPRPAGDRRLLGGVPRRVVVDGHVQAHVGHLQRQPASDADGAPGDQRPAPREGRRQPVPSSSASRRAARPRWEIAAFSAAVISAIDRVSPSGRNSGS